MALRLRLPMFFLLVLLPAALSAQERTPRRGPRPSVGGEVGYSRSDLGGPDAQRVRSRQGALTGVYIQVPLTGPLSIRPEILFALKGGRVQADVEGGGTVELDIGLAYLELPVLLRRVRGVGGFARWCSAARRPRSRSAATSRSRTPTPRSGLLVRKPTCRPSGSSTWAWSPAAGWRCGGRSRRWRSRRGTRRDCGRC